jgi:hypothetical protein
MADTLIYIFSEIFLIEGQCTVVSDESSDELESLSSIVNNRAQRSTSGRDRPKTDDSLYLVYEVIFHHGDQTFERGFPNNVGAEVSVVFGI